MKKRSLTLPYITVTSADMNEVLKNTSSSGLHLVSDGIRFSLWNVTRTNGIDYETAVLIWNDLPVSIIEEVEENEETKKDIVSEIIPKRNGCCEWVSSKTLLEIIKMLS